MVYSVCVAVSSSGGPGEKPVVIFGVAFPQPVVSVALHVAVLITEMVLPNGSAA